MQFILGPTMAFRRETIRRMGGFKVTADYCADDFVLGNETFKLGQTVVLSHHAIDHIVLNSSFWSSMQHQVRWMKSTRFSRPKGHFGTALTFSMPFGLLGLAAGVLLGHVGWGVALLAWAVATRLALSIAVGRHGGARSKLVEPAGALSVARPDGIRLLGGELYGQSHSVARTGVSVAAGWEDARGEIGWKGIQDRKRWVLLAERVICAACEAKAAADPSAALGMTELGWCGREWFPRSQKRDPSTSLRAGSGAPRFSVPLAPIRH